MKAIILDIDGTLIDSSSVDNRLYMSAIGKVLGRIRLREDWTSYRNVTDSGLLEEIASDNGIALDAETLSEIQQLFFNKLERQLEQHGPFPEIPGAHAFVERLRTAPNYLVAYATGAWRRSATMKLAASGFPLGDVPLASSDDFPDRRSIMLHACEQLPLAADEITYYGDGLWDQKAAAGLGWRFIAVGARLGGLERYLESEGTD